MLHPVAPSEYPAGAGGPSPMTLGSPQQLPPISIIEAIKEDGSRTIRTLDDRNIYVIKDKGSRPLGAGFSCVVLPATGFTTEGAPLATPFAVAKIKQDILFDLDAFNLVTRLPESPHLLARPLKFFKSKKANMSMVMERLENPDLITLMIKETNAFDQWFLGIQGLLNGARGLKILHDHGIIHRDIRFDNISTSKDEPLKGGLFDYGSLIQETEFKRFNGAPFDQSPPEILRAIHSFSTPAERHLIEKILNDRDTHLPQAHHLLNRTFKTDYSLPTAVLQFKGHPRALIGYIQYTKAVDIFILGYQLEFLLNSFSFEHEQVTWAEYPEQLERLRDKLFLTSDTQHFINRMGDPDPLKRPSVDDVIRFLESYHAELKKVKDSPSSS